MRRWTSVATFAPPTFPPPPVLPSMTTALPLPRRPIHYQSKFEDDDDDDDDDDDEGDRDNDDGACSLTPCSATSSRNLGSSARLQISEREANDQDLKHDAPNSKLLRRKTSKI